MAVSHLDSSHRGMQRSPALTVRRYDPDALRTTSRDRCDAAPTRGQLPYRTLLLGGIVAGGLLQHALVGLPLEAQPVPFAVASAQVASVPQAVPAAQPARPVARHRPRAGHGLLAPVPVQPPRRAARRHRGSAAPVGDALASTSQVHLTAGSSGVPHLASWLPPVGTAGDRVRVAMGANTLGEIMHRPSVSVGAIRDALAAAGSPAAGAQFADHKDAGEYIWDEGRVLGVDPAVVMAIFRHESGFGTQGMARQTHSVGNIRPLSGQPQINGYRLYVSWEQGVDDCYRLLRSYAKQGAGTIPQAIPVWAPPSDNNDDSAYIASVLGTMGSLYSASVGQAQQP